MHINIFICCTFVAEIKIVAAGLLCFQQPLPATYTAIYLSICTAIYLSICAAIYLNICTSIYLCICTAIYLIIYTAIYLSICTAIYLIIYTTICLSICTAIYLIIYTTICLSICTAIYLIICTAFYLSIPSLSHELKWTFKFSITHVGCCKAMPYLCQPYFSDGSEVITAINATAYFPVLVSDGMHPLRHCVAYVLADVVHADILWRCLNTAVMCLCLCASLYTECRLIANSYARAISGVTLAEMFLAR